jgi:hypothetical protein
MVTFGRTLVSMRANTEPSERPAEFYFFGWL